MDRNAPKSEEYYKPHCDCPSPARTMARTVVSSRSYSCKTLAHTDRHRLTFKVLYICTVILLLSCVPLATCQQDTDVPANGTQTQPGDGGSGSPGDTAVDRALYPLYYMTRGFLNLVQPEQSGFILEEADIVQDVVNGDVEVILMSMEDWKLWVTHYLGFVICACVGVLFIVVMPIVGFCFCCCRCCGNCGGRGDMEERKGDRCKRGCCGALLAIFSLILIAGMICGFMTNEVLRVQTSGDTDDSLLVTVSRELQHLENYKVTTMKTFRSSVVGSITEITEDIVDHIENAAEDVKNDLGEITRSDELLNEAIALADASQQINAALKIMYNNTGDLVQQRTQLNASLSTVRTSLLDQLDGCTEQVCVDLRTSVGSLSPRADFSQVDDVSDELRTIKEILDNNFSGNIRNGYEDYENITARIHSNILDELNDAEVEIEKIKDSVTKKVDQVLDDINSVNFNSTKKTVNSFQPELSEYGNYRYYGGIVLCCVLMLVVVFCLLGLCLGVCGEPAGDDSPSCNRGIGANLLMVGVAFSFMFAWILMIIILIVFLGGGLVYTEVCRFAVDIPNSPQPIKNTINTFVNTQLESMEYEIDIPKVIDDCNQNKALFESLDLDKFVNLTAQMDVNNYNVKGTIDDIVNSISIDLSDVTIFSNKSRSQMTQLENSKLLDINFTTYFVQFDLPVVQPNLDDLITQLNDAANQLRPADPDLALQLEAYANALRSAQDSTIAAMQAEIDEMKNAVDDLVNVVDGPPTFNKRIQDVIAILEDAQRKIQVNGTAYIKQFVRQTGNEILEKLEAETNDLAYDIQHNIGRCKPVATSLQNVVNAGCVTVLDPFNGFWFCIGMCLIVLIPVIITSVHLAGLYRKTDEFYDDKSFDDVRMPLARNRQQYDRYNPQERPTRSNRGPRIY